MKKHFLAMIVIAFSTLQAATVSVVNQPAQVVSVPSGTTTTPAGTSPSMGQNNNQYNQTTTNQKNVGPALGKPQAHVKEGRAPRKPRVESVQSAAFAETPVYTYPGLVAKIGSRWVGSDYLYNLNKNIGIKIEIVKQEGKEISIDEEGLSQLVAEIFQGAGIVPESLASADSPPLPFFHILIFALPADNMNIAFVSGRLFEDALLARYGLEPIGTWQAISWEKQDLVVTSPLQFEDQLRKSVAGIAATFVNRVEVYAKIKAETESDAKLYYPSVIPAHPKPKMLRPVPTEPVIEKFTEIEFPRCACD